MALGSEVTTVWQANGIVVATTLAVVVLCVVLHYESLSWLKSVFLADVAGSALVSGRSHSVLQPQVQLLSLV